MIIFLFYGLATQLLSVPVSLSVQFLVFCTMISESILNLDVLRHCESNRRVNAFVFLSYEYVTRGAASFTALE